MSGEEVKMSGEAQKNFVYTAYTLKLLKPLGASLASLGVLSTKIAEGCQPGTRLILNHDTIPYL